MNGLVRSGNSLSVTGGVTIAQGLTVAGGIVLDTNSLSVSAGPISITSTSSSAAPLFANSAAGVTFDSHGILGRTAVADVSTANVASFMEGNNQLARVRLSLCRRAT
jgi:hypothetical protein